ncbi:MAG TPA: DUF3224 domain-containing protein [Candidatus Saccharimonadales bacterium]|nr:DUF3224 domain-containing protein [Candidatus Saccharimonadales bacterium]
MRHAVSPFQLDSFEEQPPYAQDDGVIYTRVQISKTFSGDLEAQSKVEMLSVRAEPGGAGYVAVERIVGKLQGKSGSFALLHIGTMQGTTPWARWPIVPGSGGGELVGISGEARIEIASDGAHTLFLDYELS